MQRNDAVSLIMHNSLRFKKPQKASQLSPFNACDSVNFINDYVVFDSELLVGMPPPEKVSVTLTFASITFKT